MPEFYVPDLGEGLQEATIVDWLVTNGDEVTLNQPLVVLETEKAEVEVPSPFAGRVTELGGAEGETLKVGTLLARIDPTDAETPSTGRKSTLVGYGHDESIDRSRRRRESRPADRPATSAPTPSGPTAAPTQGKPLAKPPVRKLASRLNVDLAAIPASGRDGIVTRGDVEAAAALSSDAAHSPGLTDTITPVRGIRARIADRMTLSRSTIPDATCAVTVDCTRLLETRAALNRLARLRGLDPIVTPFSLIARLVVQALKTNPIFNATFIESGPEIRLFRAIHLGIGTATERGLLVTVLKNAESRSTLDLSSEMARLGAGARAGQLSPSELSGSTFTLSNFGALGIDEGIPVINYPEAAILGVGSIKERPHAINGAILARATASLTLAFDHRVCDGAEAGRFVGEVRSLVESPELALLDS